MELRRRTVVYVLYRCRLDRGGRTRNRHLYQQFGARRMGLERRCGDLTNFIGQTPPRYVGFNFPVGYDSLTAAIHQAWIELGAPFGSVRAPNDTENTVVPQAETLAFEKRHAQTASAAEYGAMRERIETNYDNMTLSCDLLREMHKYAVGAHNPGAGNWKTRRNYFPVFDAEGTWVSARITTDIEDVPDCWSAAQHDPTPWCRYMVDLVLDAYREITARTNALSTLANHRPPQTHPGRPRYNHDDRSSPDEKAWNASIIVERERRSVVEELTHAEPDQSYARRVFSSASVG